ncbi:MAG: Fe-S cluster assembly protein SufD [Chloroflexi bacterium]|nr:Fe-S cluster assembly protein SufD [Chloroflexota bacterium]
MEEKPRVVVARTRRAKPIGGDFRFEAGMALPGALAGFRARAWQAWQAQPLPSVADEPWRRTDLRNLPAAEFRLPGEGARRNLPPVPEALLQSLAADRHGGQVVLLPGADAEGQGVSPALAARGVIFADLRTAEARHPDLLRRLAGQVVRPEEGKFAALAGALACNGVLLYVPKGVSVEEPLHSLLWGPGSGLAHISHLLVFVDEGASLTYIHEAASPDEAGDALAAGIIEIELAENASLRFVELQSWGRHVWNFNHERIRLGRGASLDWIFGAIGSRLTKNFMELDLAGVGASGRMSGFYFADGSQHLDHDTQQNHLAPHTSSDLLFKGALKGHSRSVWQGMIHVAPGADKTDGYQANRNLALSPDARADSIPGLEILTDDVRCTHGATVGQLEKEPLFYLNSRGIPRQEAERILVEGFFDPIMQRIPFEGVRRRFQQSIASKMV